MELTQEQRLILEDIKFYLKRDLKLKYINSPKMEEEIVTLALKGFLRLYK